MGEMSCGRNYKKKKILKIVTCPNNIADIFFVLFCLFTNLLVQMQYSQTGLSLYQGTAREGHF